MSLSRQAVSRIVRYVVIEQEASQYFEIHLTGHQQVNLSSMIFIICQTFVHLRARQIRKTVRNDCVHSLAVLQQANHVMNTNPGARDNRIAAPYAGQSSNVSVFSGYCGIAIIGFELTHVTNSNTA